MVLGQSVLEDRLAFWRGCPLRFCESCLLESVDFLTRVWAAIFKH